MAEKENPVNHAVSVLSPSASIPPTSLPGQESFLDKILKYRVFPKSRYF